MAPAELPAFPHRHVVQTWRPIACAADGTVTPRQRGGQGISIQTFTVPWLSTEIGPTDTADVPPRLYSGICEALVQKISISPQLKWINSRKMVNSGENKSSCF